MFLKVDSGLYRVMLVQSSQVITAKHVILEERLFPLAWEQAATIILGESLENVVKEEPKNSADSEVVTTNSCFLNQRSMTEHPVCGHHWQNRMEMDKTLVRDPPDNATTSETPLRKGYLTARSLNTCEELKRYRLRERKKRIIFIITA